VVTHDGDEIRGREPDRRCAERQHHGAGDEVSPPGNAPLAIAGALAVSVAAPTDMTQGGVLKPARRGARR
jgi:hypothetical protein